MTPDRMPDERLAEIKSKLKTATADKDYYTAQVFSLYAPEIVAELVAEVERLQDEKGELRAEIGGLEKKLNFTLECNCRLSRQGRFA